MANTSAIGIGINSTTKAELNNIQAGIFENLQKESLAMLLKSKNANLTEKAGSYEFKRYANATSKAYGTARTARKGDSLTAPSKTVNVNTHREIIEEFPKFDAERFGLDAGVTSLANRRKKAHEQAVLAELDTAFFAEIKTAVDAEVTAKTLTVSGTALDITKPLGAQFEAIISAFEETKNDYVRGIPRSEMVIVTKPSIYGLLKSELNDCFNANFSVESEKIKGYNGVAFFSSVFLPSGVDYMLMVIDSVAEPVNTDSYDVEKISLSNDFALELFYDYGAKAIAPDLLRYGATPVPKT